MDWCDATHLLRGVAPLLLRVARLLGVLGRVGPWLGRVGEPSSRALGEGRRRWEVGEERRDGTPTCWPFLSSGPAKIMVSQVRTGKSICIYATDEEN